MKLQISIKIKVSVVILGDSGLSDGAIAGIVIGVIAFLIILAIILFFCCVRKAPQKSKRGFQ